MIIERKIHHHVTDMMSVRCVCWCATCDRHKHTHVYLYIYIYIYIYVFVYFSFWFASVRMRANIADSTLVKTRAAEPDSNCTRSAEKTQSPYPSCSKHNKAYSDCHELFVSWVCAKRFAGDPTQLPQVLAAHITSPTCVENCADRKHGQKRIVKHADLLLDLRALWPKLTFCQSTMTEREKQKRQDRESERDHEKFFKKKKSDQDDDCM